MDNTKLKPCPCHYVNDEAINTGYHAPKLHVMSNKKYEIVCRICGLHSAFYETEEEAIAAWNTRPIEDSLNTRIIKLYEILSKSKPLEPEFKKVLDDNFFDLLIGNEDDK